MKKYIRDHKGFCITVLVLLLISTSSFLFLLINIKNDNRITEMSDLENKTFTYSIDNTKTKISFKELNLGVKELIIDDEKSSYNFNYALSTDKEFGSVIIITNIDQQSMYKYKNNCIYDVFVPEILYCTK